MGNIFSNGFELPNMGSFMSSGNVANAATTLMNVGSNNKRTVPTAINTKKVNNSGNNMNLNNFNINNMAGNNMAGNAAPGNNSAAVVGGRRRKSRSRGNRLRRKGSRRSQRK